MIDAILYAVRDGIRTTIPNYGVAECEIMDDGRPPPRCGNYFAAVHGGRTRPRGDANRRNLYEIYGFSVTLTMRVTVPLDRVGDQQIARSLSLVPQGQRQGFHHKAEQIRAFLHVNWARIVQMGQSPNSANDNLAAWCKDTVYGFATPVSYQGMDDIRLVGGEWFNADPDTEDIGIVAEMKFDGAERMQPQTAATGVFV